MAQSEAKRFNLLSLVIKKKKAITVEAGHHQRFPPDAANHLHGTENKIISD